MKTNIFLKKVVLLIVSTCFTSMLLGQPTYEFTNCGQEGRYGPSQEQCDTEYGAGMVTVVDGIQEWTVPYSGIYTIDAFGAEGGRGKQYNTYVYTNGIPGKGARMSGSFDLNVGDVIQILVGQLGGESLANHQQRGGGGGGGSFIVSQQNQLPLIIAAGGGGAGRYDGNDGDDGITTADGTNGNGNGGIGGVDGFGGMVPGASYAGGSGAGFYGDGESACSNGILSYGFINGGAGSNGGGTGYLLQHKL